MTKEELWELYCGKNPTFSKEGNVTMSTKGLKRLFDQTYAQGLKEGKKPNVGLDADSRSVFEQMFGKSHGGY